MIISPNSGLTPAGRPDKKAEVMPEMMLYNLKADIAEENNVAEQYPEKAEELKQHLAKKIKDGRSTPGKLQKNDEISFPWPQAAFAFE